MDVLLPSTTGPITDACLHLVIQPLESVGVIAIFFLDFERGEDMMAKICSFIFAFLCEYTHIIWIISLPSGTYGKFE